MDRELLQKAMAAWDPEELLALARAGGVPVTEDEARAHFTRLHPPAGELSDDELEAVSGGGCGGGGRPYEPRYPVGSYVKFKAGATESKAHDGSCACRRLIVTAAYDYKAPNPGGVTHYGANDLKCTDGKCGAVFTGVRESDLERCEGV